MIFPICGLRLYLSGREGSITGAVGILMMPWKLLHDFVSYIFGWLVGCSAFLGPIAGIMIFDYYVGGTATLLWRTCIEGTERTNISMDLITGLCWRWSRELESH